MSTTTVYERAMNQLALSIAEQCAFFGKDTVALLVEKISELRGSFRWYYLSRESVRGFIWPIFRQNEDVMDLLMNITVDWNCRLSGLAATIELEAGQSIDDRYIIEMVALGICSTVAQTCPENQQVTDIEFRAKMAPKTEVNELLRSDGWLLVLAVLTLNLSRFLTQLREAGMNNA